LTDEGLSERRRSADANGRENSNQEPRLGGHVNSSTHPRRVRRGLVAGALVLAGASAVTVPAIPAAAFAPVEAGTMTVNKTAFVLGEKVTVTVTIPTKAKTARATGTVEVTVDDGEPIRVPVNSAGKAVYATTALPLGGHTVVGEYLGDAKYGAGSTGSVSFDVVKGATTTKVTSLREPIPTGSRARINARTMRIAPARGSLVGTTTFIAVPSAGDPVMSEPVATNSVGTALWQPKLPDGSWTVTAHFDGNAGLDGATSDPINVLVGTPDTEPWGKPSDTALSPIEPGVDASQTFKAGRTGLLDRVDLDVTMPLGVSDSTLFVTINTVDSMGYPTSTVIGSGTTTGPVAGDGADDSVQLTSPAPVTAGTSYAIVLNTDSGTWHVHGSYASYPDGQSRWNGGMEYGDWDFRFRTWIS
jgi:hypothetical protein